MDESITNDFFSFLDHLQKECIATNNNVSLHVLSAAREIALTDIRNHLLVELVRRYESDSYDMNESTAKALPGITRPQNGSTVTSYWIDTHLQTKSIQELRDMIQGFTPKKASKTG